ncbi:hypothetical protein DFH08DRAFT_970889 [Mycena albidolilacea]|uniref:Uncharacterized protein n=1 Tax=Mycena albidolilacea TaxID=1033008 RepID=A0AAD6ZEP5_9AGAR|nr:hypothetical protein DFH08DRAFT_970889 [Mycena albidolilacea]
MLSAPAPLPFWDEHRFLQPSADSTSNFGNELKPKPQAIRLFSRSRLPLLTNHASMNINARRVYGTYKDNSRAQGSQLRAVAQYTGTFSRNIQAATPVYLLRTLGPTALEYRQSSHSVSDANELPGYIGHIRDCVANIFLP